MKALLRRVREKGATRLARKFVGTWALEGWATAVRKAQGLAGESIAAAAPVVRPASDAARDSYELGRVAQYDYCRRYAEQPSKHRRRMLQELLRSEADCRGVIICPVSYDLSIRQRPDHLMRYWGEQGFLCLLLSVDSTVPSIERRGERFYHATLYEDVLAYFRDRPVVAYITGSMFAYLPRLLGRAFIVYDVLDSTDLYRHYGPTAMEDHEALLARADLAMFTSTTLFDQHASRTRRALLVPNGVFPKDFVLPDAAPTAPPLVVGYHGAISEYLDFDLLESIADLPDTHLVMVGPVTTFATEHAEMVARRTEALFARDNVRYLGALAYTDLPGYLAGIHCAVVPFLANTVTDSVSPLKLFEYVAARKPVLALPTKTLLQLADTIFIGEADSIVERIASGRWSDVDAAKYEAVIARHSWPELLRDVTASLDAWSVAGSTLPGIDMPTSDRVDIVNFNFFDWDGEKIYNGGAERYVHDLARLCKRLGLRPRLLQNGRRAFERTYGDIPVVGLPLCDVFDLAVMSSGFNAAVRDAGLVIASPVDLAARLDASLRIVGINHGIYWDGAGNRLGNYTVERHALVFDALRNVDACVCVDTNFINWVRCFDWLLGQMLDYIPNYADLRAFRAVEKDFSESPLRLLYPRRLYHPRGFQDTLRAVELLFRQGIDVELTLCGGADDKDAALASAFVARYPDRARWHELPIDAMSQAYETSHVVLIPTNYAEGTSLSCIEAMATNNAVIATTVGGLPNLVLDGYNGLLIKPGAVELAAAITRLATQRDLAERLAGNARHVALEFSRDRWERRWTDVLRGYFPNATAPARESRVEVAVSAV